MKPGFGQAVFVVETGSSQQGSRDGVNADIDAGIGGYEVVVSRICIEEQVNARVLVAF